MVDKITVPTLIVHAANDPFIRILPETRRKIASNPNINFIETEDGGHCAFVGRRNGTRRRLLGREPDRGFSAQVLMDADFSVELGTRRSGAGFSVDRSGRQIRVCRFEASSGIAGGGARGESVSRTRPSFCASSILARSIVESAKCDAWSTDELTPEEEIFGASHKFASYVDLVVQRARSSRIVSVSRTFCEAIGRIAATDSGNGVVGWKCASGVRTMRSKAKTSRRFLLHALRERLRRRRGQSAPKLGDCASAGRATLFCSCRPWIDVNGLGHVDLAGVVALKESRSQRLPRSSASRFGSAADDSASIIRKIVRQPDGRRANVIGMLRQDRNASIDKFDVHPVDEQRCLSQLDERTESARAPVPIVHHA